MKDVAMEHQYTQMIVNSWDWKIAPFVVNFDVELACKTEMSKSRKWQSMCTLNEKSYGSNLRADKQWFITTYVTCYILYFFLLLINIKKKFIQWCQIL